MVERHTKATQLVLVLHTAVDYVYAQGVGIGLVQRAECATTGIIKNNIIQTKERKYSIKRENFAVENVKTPKRALMLALLHALGLACGTIKGCCPKTVQLQKVTILSSSPTIVQIRGGTARTIARQRGRKACRSRRQLRLVQDDTSTEAQLL
ncbi:hypothetical protein K469DRAFT_591561 [Zopfia rhizophila CBS 207.26]|uniref:Secreted protein n=1 Tax=Zopfia rhizophila CBS 207.26 TaxID=1314779 RepID=A0A6A6DQZ9_9PEZI|nr:hypothetical protein K469DRAFT_591561 [Zopfia rhizophila CBS 207.26]